MRGSYKTITVDEYNLIKNMPNDEPQDDDQCYAINGENDRVLKTLIPISLRQDFSQPDSMGMSNDNDDSHNAELKYTQKLSSNAKQYYNEIDDQHQDGGIQNQINEFRKSPFQDTRNVRQYYQEEEYENISNEFEDDALKGDFDQISEREMQQDMQQLFKGNHSLQHQHSKQKGSPKKKIESFEKVLPKTIHTDSNIEEEVYNTRQLQQMHQMHQMNQMHQMDGNLRRKQLDGGDSP